METVRRTLKLAGLTERETDVYLLLGGKSFLTGMEVARMLDMHKAQAYTILEKLQEKRMVEGTVGTPTRYYPVQIEEALDEVVRSKRLEADSIADHRDEVLSFWHALQPSTTTFVPERFATLPTRKAIHSRILDMVKNAEHEILILFTIKEVIRADNTNLFEALEERVGKQRNLRTQILAPVLIEDMGIVKTFLDEMRGRKLRAEWRHTEVDSIRDSSLLITDGKESCIISDLPHNKSPGTAFWSNGEVLTRICAALFNELWRGKMLAEQRIEELQTEGQPNVSMQIDDPREARKRFLATIRKAKREVTHLLPYSRFLEDDELRPFRQIPLRGVKVRVMCPRPVRKAIRKLPDNWAIKDPEVDYMAISAIDRTHLFRFNLPTDTERANTKECFRSMTYTNDTKQVVPICQMLDGLWERAIKIQ